MNRKSTPIPEPIAQLQRQLDEFRSTHATRTKLPEPLWQAAVELARQHGVHAVAHPLRCSVNSFDYLIDLQRHAPELAANPAAWMPWNYRETLQGVEI